MSAKLITYDLVNPGRNYDDLHEAIKALGSWWHCVESTWIVKTDLSVSTIRDRLTAHIDANDLLVVLGLNGNWATMHLSDQCNSWLRDNL